VEAKAHELDLEVIVGADSLERRLSVEDINRPGLALAGYLEYFAYDRVQVLGNTEIHYMEQLPEEVLLERLDNIFTFEIPCFIVSRGLEPPETFVRKAAENKTPVLRSSQTTNQVITKVIVYLIGEFCPETTVHGVICDVFGVGVLILGKPGVGKSETALELIERGHRLIADDVIFIKRLRDNAVYAIASDVLGHSMEIRGVGIIDVKSIYGVGSIRESKRVNLVVQLEDWDESKKYDRVGLTEDMHTILGVEIPKVTIPVRPGRNLAIIVEVAALNQRLKELGTHTAKELNLKIMQRMLGSREKSSE